MYQVLYIDDEVEERQTQRLVDLFNEGDKLDCHLQLPQKDFSGLDLQAYDALLVDFELVRAQINGSNVTYHGNTLATEIRLQNQIIPIILITRKTLIQDDTLLASIASDVDLILFKDEVNSNPDAERGKIVSLVNGFQQLTKIDGKPWDDVLNAMGANEREKRTLREAFPPIQQGKWSVPKTADWIRNVVMQYPGILYSELDASTRLGISLDSFLRSEIQSIFETALYRGVFQDFGRRWWVDRLVGIAKDLLLKNGYTGAVSDYFIHAVNKEWSIELSPSICIYDGTPVAERVCYVYQQPVKLSNSLRYYPDSRPPVMDEARVSFKAIKESNDFDETLVDADSYDLVQELWDN